MPTIKTEKLTKYYPVRRSQRGPGGRKKEIGVEDVDLTIEQGDFVFVIGSCGAGKSTLLNLLAGQLRASRGKAWLGGKSIRKLLPWNRERLSLKMGFVPQRYQLDHGKMVIEILEKAAKAGFHKFRDRDNCEKRIQKVLGLTGLTGVEYKYPIELTYGQRRRVELARALINSPPVLILDEITAGLDHDSMWDVYLLLDEINRMGITVVMATHSSFYVNMSRRRVITLVHGRVYSDEQRGRYGEVKSGKPGA